MTNSSKHEPGTQAIHADDASRGGAVVAPISQATTFAAATDAAFLDAATRSFTDDFYIRYGTPNHTQVADVVAALEGADRALVTAGGMGAVSTVALALLTAGDHVVAQTSIYPGTTTLVGTLLARFGVSSTTIDLTDLVALEDALSVPTRLVFVETPSNPFLGVVDVAAVSHLAHRHGATVLVDNTIATPINQRPLELGADLVWHSATKYLGGHSDVSAGVVAGHTDVIEEIWRTHLVVGSVLGPFDAWLLLRGLRTLDVRMARHNDNATALAQLLSDHDLVGTVYYPGLKDHPQHELAASQMSGFGGLLSFEMRGGAPAADRLLDSLTLSTRAASLGSVFTLGTRPAVMWGDTRNYDASASEAVPPGLVRLSVGIEATRDLLDDLERGLDACRDGAASGS
ncbi:MAG TPA: PLP-dependent aspartate aminotransferase family protein [Acidimicrobiales bacterium]|jgi:methionine-gamma-lyase|nr:PLP-dependent aspartate aminotransferase family protein [Acidimicrobiales bacterium]